MRGRPAPALLWGAGACLAAALGCGGGPMPCATSGECAEGTVCQADGRCSPLVAGRRPGRVRWLSPRDWGVTRRDRFGTPSPATDVLELGGAADAVVHLSFGPLPARTEARAVRLRLWPHESWSGPPAEGRLVVQRTAGFQGSTLTRRSAPRATGAPLAERRVPAGAARPIAIDLTDAVRRGQRRGERSLHVAVRLLDGDGPGWRLASPQALDRALRPRLELEL